MKIEDNFNDRNIAIKDLSLWDENARFPDKYFNKPEDELINYFLSKINFKIKEFTKAVIADQDLPQLEKLVVYDYNGKLIVLEGNRRLVVYKLLSNPKLSPSKNLEIFFEDLRSKNNINDNFTLECLVTTDKLQGLRYIERKHLNRNNEIGWGEAERTNYNVRRGRAKKQEIFRDEISKIVKRADLPEEIKDKVLGPGYVTNFYRVIDSNPAWEHFGFSLGDDKKLGIKDVDFEKKLKVIVWNILNKKDFRGNTIDSRYLNKKDAIGAYIGRLKATDVDQVDDDIKKCTEVNLLGEQTITPLVQGQLHRTPITRETYELFGRTLILQSGKVNDLYRALVEIDKKCGNNDAALPFLGMALRLLVEVAARVYFEKQGATQITNQDQVCETFLKQAKKELGQQQKNAISLTNEWLSDQRNLSAILNKYAHGNIIYKRSDVLKDSLIVADILEFYFKRQ